MTRAVLPACRVKACAKVNLDLRVLGVLPDGYHAIATVFQSVDLADELSIEPRQGGDPAAGGASAWLEPPEPVEGLSLSISCNDPSVPGDRRNLVWRAAQAFQRALGLDLPPLHVHIEKAIPAEAGLGGGSADGAAMLAGLNAMLGLPASRDRLASVAAAVGADVPFMLLGGTALGTRRGDVLDPLPDLPAFEMVVAHPGFGVSTAEAYQWFHDTGPAPSPAPAWPASSAGWRQVLAACRNDLEAAVCRRHPAIAGLVNELRGDGALTAAMTGSGSAVFGLFEPGGQASTAAARLAAGGTFVRVVRTLGRAEFDIVTRPVLAAVTALRGARGPC